MTDGEPIETTEQPPTEDVADGARSTRKRHPVLILSIVGGVVVIGLLVTIIVLLIPRSPNAQACKDYATGYNGLAGAVRLSKDDKADGPALVKSMESNMAVLMAKAAGEAHGNVASAMLDSATLAQGDLSSSDTGTAFFMSTNDVKDACGADGAAITLDPFK